MRFAPTHIALPVLGIDPGKNALGWGYADQTGHVASVVRAGVVRAETPTRPGGDDVGAVAQHLMNHLRLALRGLPQVRTLIIEKMKVYPGPHAKGDPADLLELAYISGGVHMLPEMSPDVQVILVDAHSWKGQVPKATMQKRRIEPALEPYELAMVKASMQTVPEGLRHNGWDGVGLVLWALRRLNRNLEIQT